MSKVFVAMMYGQGGEAADIALSFNPPSGGLDRLAGRIRALGAECHLYTWDSATRIAAVIKSQPPSTRIVIGGASLGANESPRAGDSAYPRIIDFMFGIQPSLYGAKNLVTSNVKRAMYWYQPWGFGLGIGFGLGSYQWGRTAANTTTTMIGKYSFRSHPGDDAEAVQLVILDEIKKLM